MKVVRIRMLTAVFLADMTPRKPEDRVGRSSHRADLGDRSDDRPRCRPDREAERDRDEQVLDELLERLLPLDPAHAEPEIIVGREEQIPDQHRLDDEQPRERPAHHRQAERLRVARRSPSRASSRRMAAAGTR